MRPPRRRSGGGARSRKRQGIMKHLGLFAVAFAVLGAGTPLPPDASSAEALATQRRVHGVITAASPTELTIASKQASVSGRIDPARTKVTVQGRPGTLADLKLTAHAKGELCLEDVWLAIDTH